MNKRETLKILHNCVMLYDTNLKNNNIMFVIENKKSPTIKESISFIETIYYPHNFLHLTGLKYQPQDKNIVSKYQIATDFYKKLIQQKLPLSSIEYINPFTTELKLGILHHLGNIDKSAKFLGNYNNNIKDKLYTEKVVGNVSYCFGFVKDSASNYFYVPNSTIKENIKNITDDTCNIIAILKKEKSKEFYSSITYLKNNIDLNCLLRNDNLANLIDFEHIEFANNDDVKNVVKVNGFKQELIDIVNKISQENVVENDNQAIEENKFDFDPSDEF